jgi:hypothetical protein
VACDVCEGLAYAHEKGVIHRDIKPGNVLLEADGRAVVVDFGVARIVEGDPNSHALTTQALMGTPAFMAPEQLEGRRVDHRVDLYAVGVMLYEMCCAQLPRGHFDPPSHFPGVPAEMDAVVLRAIRTDPEQRFASAAEMLGALRAVQAAVVGPRVEEKPSTGKPVRTVALVGAALLVVLPGVFFSLRKGDAPPPASSESSEKAPGLVEPPVKSAAGVANTGTTESARGPVWHEWTGAEESATGGILSRTAEGWVPHPADGADGVNLVCGPALKDQALRVTWVAIAKKPRPVLRLMCRAREDLATGYGVQAFKQSINLLRHDALSKERSLKALPKPENWGDAHEHVYELRAEGETLTFLLDGQAIGSHAEHRYAVGHPALFCNGSVALKKVEWCDLGGRR